MPQRIVRAPASPPRIGAADSTAERQADRAADAVLVGRRVPAVGTASAAEERRRDEGPGASAARTAARAVAGAGAPLPAALRSYFEPRFGRDLGGVRIHTDATAGTAARAIGARAYTLGRDIGFAAGEYAPATREGRRLIAHELAHVAQHGPAAPPTIRRTVARSSACPPNAHGAPADPLATLRALDARAQLMALGASRLLASEALAIREGLGPGEASRAYRRRYGRPIAADGQFRDRFTGRLHATEVETTSAEMELLSLRFQLLHRFLADPVRYLCPGTAAITVGSCSGQCEVSRPGAWTCLGTQTIVLCPVFWHPAMTADERAGGIVHEAGHLVWSFGGDHPSATQGQRAQNPECFNSFLADIFGFRALSATCPALPG